MTAPIRGPATLSVCGPAWQLDPCSAFDRVKMCGEGDSAAVTKRRRFVC